MSRIIRWAREVLDISGLSHSVTCPWCGMRDYPVGTQGEEVACSTCGNPYILPWLYYKKQIPDYFEDTVGVK